MRRTILTFEMSRELSGREAKIECEFKLKEDLQCVSQHFHKNTSMQR
jgi:hypothetical protein